MAVLLFLFAHGCGTLECGEGAVEVDGECVAAGTFLKCGVGFRANGDTCEPEPEWVKSYCGPNTEYDKEQNKCVGTGGGAACAKTCSPATGNNICVQGRAFEGITMITQGAAAATPIKKSDGAVIRIYDPFDFLTNPNPSPLGEAPIEDENGCFIVEDIPVPFANSLGIAVEDAVSTDKNFALMLYGAAVAAGQNRTNMEIPGVTAKVASDWGNDMVKDGTCIVWFRNQTTRNSIEGVVPLIDGNPPPFAGSPEFYFDADPLQAPYFDDKATETTKSGMVAIKNAQVKTYTGLKQGCTFASVTGGSVPGVLVMIAVESTDC